MQRISRARGERTVAETAAAQPSINSTVDAYEVEADRVADRAMGRYGGGAPAAEATAASPPAAPGASRASGAPLEPALRRSLEPHLGHDLGQVRIHADPEAAESARAINARAYTQGRDVFFGAGEYVPGTRAGKWLLAHELTHVVQQEGAGGASGGLRARQQIMRKERDAAPRAVPENAKEAQSWFYADDSTGHVVSVYFARGISELDQAAEAVLEEALEVVDDLGRVKSVRFEGYTDSVGDVASNQTLSEQRAQRVAEWFQIPDDREPQTHSAGFGRRGPEPTAKNAATLSRYRRVDVIISPPRMTTPHEPPDETRPGKRSQKLKTTISLAVGALEKSAEALRLAVLGPPALETVTALERYYPQPRYQTGDFARVLLGEVEHLRGRIESIRYQEFRDEVEVEQQICNPENPSYDRALCAVLSIPGAAFPPDKPTHIVLSPKWRGHSRQDIAVAVLIHEAAHLLLGYRGHPTEFPHRNPRAIVGFVGSLGGFFTPGADAVYPANP